MTQDDKELLVLAAKAAGIFLTPEKFATESTSPWDADWEPWYSASKNCMVGMVTCYNYKGELSGWTVFEWFPLSDDGDALRLEVMLKLDAQWDVKSQTWGIYHVSKGFYIALARDPDRKRATTMAAAEIGRTM